MQNLFNQSIAPSIDLVACIPARSQVARTGPLPISLSPFPPFSLWGYIQGGVFLAVLVLAIDPLLLPPPALGRISFTPHIRITFQSQHSAYHPVTSTHNTYIKPH
jgi:hypothetical protein